MADARENTSGVIQRISVDEALDYILSHITRLGSQPESILEALGCVVDGDIVSDADIPSFVNSAMDGYAVRAADTRGATRQTPVALRVTGEVAAGGMPDRTLEPHTAIRIMTGAPMPSGSDAVVKFEATDEGRREVNIYAQAEVEENVRQAGEDVARGQVVLPAGHVLRPADIGVLAAMGYAQVNVVRRPRVAILATGNELVDINDPITPGKIRNSNEYTSTVLVKRYGGFPIPLGIARDTTASLQAKIRQGIAQGIDLFLTSAGVSVGDFDMVKDVLATEGEMHFWQVKIKPGKPLAFGSVAGIPLLGLPGNPAAAMVAFEVFARPAILKLSGHRNWKKPSVTAILDEDVRNSGRRHYMRARVRREVDGYHVTTRGSGVRVQGSGILSSLMWANGLAVIPEDVTFVPAGGQVDVWMLDWPEYVF